MRRTLLFHSGLFLLVYTTCLLHYWHVEPQWFAAENALAALYRHVAVASEVAGGALPGARPRLSEQALEKRVGTERLHQERSISATPVVATSEWSEATQRQVNALSTQAISAAVPSERGKAIVKLGYVEKTTQAVQALADALNGDQSEQNRVLAVVSLADMVRQGDEDGLIKTALMRAMSDPNRRVATRAREALESLSGATIAAE